MLPLGRNDTRQLNSSFSSFGRDHQHHHRPASSLFGVLRPGSRARSLASARRGSAATTAFPGHQNYGGGGGGWASSRVLGVGQTRGMKKPSVTEFVVDIQDSGGLLLSPSGKVLEPCGENPEDFVEDGSKKWQSGDPPVYAIPKTGDPWEECFGRVQRFDEEMCRGWREEIDTLLVFAGLFSAAVTAFTVESYRWLRPEPEEVGAQLLALISAQLNATATDQSQPPSISIPATQSEFEPEPAAVRVNIFWFTSLTLSLTAVLVGIMCKQWLREYQRYEGLSPREAFPVRQMRYEGLMNWHVPKFLSFLPLLLQAALIIFFAGLLDLLWSLNPLIASIITSLVGIAMILLVCTTVLPFLQHLLHFAQLGATAEPHSQCAFKSPQSRAFHLLGTSLVSVYSRVKLSLFSSTPARFMRTNLSWDSDAHWVKYDLEWQNHGRYLERGMAWFERTYGRNVDSIYDVFHCLGSLSEDVAAGCVAQIIRDTWDPLMPLAGLVMPCLEEVETLPQLAMPGGDDLDAVVARDLVEMSYALMHTKEDECFVRRCMELCARVVNCGEGRRTRYAPLVLEVLSIVVPPKEGAALPDELHLQIIGILRSFLQNDTFDIDSSDVQKFWEIFNRLRQHEYRGQDPLSKPKCLAYDLLREAELWLSRITESLTVSVQDKERIVKEFSNGLCLVYWTARQSSGVEALKASDDRYPAFRAFVQYVDGLLFGFGGASLIMSPWNSEIWDLVKKEFGSDSTVGGDQPPEQVERKD